MSSGASEQPFIGKRIVTIVCSNCNREFSDEDEIRIDSTPGAKVTPEQSYAASVAFAIQTSNFGDHVCPYCQAIEALPKYNAPEMGFRLFSPISALLTGVLFAYFVVTTLPGWINFTRTGIEVVFQNALFGVLSSLFIYLVFYFIVTFSIDVLRNEIGEIQEVAHAQTRMQFRVRFSPHPPGVREFRPGTQGVKVLFTLFLFVVCVSTVTFGLQYAINQQHVLEEFYIVDTVLRYIVAFELSVPLCIMGFALLNALLSVELSNVSLVSIGKGVLGALLFVGCFVFFVVVAGSGMNGAWVELNGYSMIDPYVSDTCDNLSALKVRDTVRSAAPEGKVWIYAPVSLVSLWATDRRGAISLDELTTLLCVTEATRLSDYSCSYTDGSKYDLEYTYWNIAVVDWATKEIIEFRELVGDGCPESITNAGGRKDSGTITGKPPSSNAFTRLLDEILPRSMKPIDMEILPTPFFSPTEVSEAVAPVVEAKAHAH